MGGHAGRPGSCLWTLWGGARCTLTVATRESSRARVLSVWHCGWQPRCSLSEERCGFPTDHTEIKGSANPLQQMATMGDPGDQDGLGCPKTSCSPCRLHPGSRLERLGHPAPCNQVFWAHLVAVPQQPSPARVLPPHENGTLSRVTLVPRVPHGWLCCHPHTSVHTLASMCKGPPASPTDPPGCYL